MTMPRVWLQLIATLTTALCLASCSTGKGGTTGGNPLNEDTSVSGAAAQALGGALSSSNSSGLQALYKYKQNEIVQRYTPLRFDFLPRAWAAGFCPTFLTAAGSTCSASGSTMTLGYQDCTFGASTAHWTGKLQLTMSSGTASCGTFPNPGASGSLYRQFVNSAGTFPGVMQIDSAYGTSAYVDHFSANLSNFDGDTIATIRNGGYGMKVDFNGSGARSSITLAERVQVIGLYDHTITGALTVTEASSSSSQRTTNGSINVYLNIVQVVGTSVFTNVVHDNTCCQPISGSITTTFAAGGSVAPIGLGTSMVGHSETLTFTGCGTADLTTFDGSVKSVQLSRCF